MNTIPNDQLTKLHNLEKLAITLDAACKSGSIETEAIEIAQEKLNKVADTLIESKTVGKNAYIVYEVQGLIHWVNGEYAEANSIISSACIIKKDKNLFTETAISLASQIKDDKINNDIRSILVKTVGFGALILVIYFIGSHVVELVLFFSGIGWEYGK